MKNVCIIGVGNIGSRHLQGLKKVNIPLSIEVVDLSKDSLEIAKQRYDQVQSKIDHKISFLQDISKISKKIDLAIVATSSNIRKKVTEDLLSISSVKYLILEKILFQKKEDYFTIEKLLKKKGCKTWVNFSMRTIPFYYDLGGKIESPIQMIVSGSNFGLITNAIHFIDYISFLTKVNNFKVFTDTLDNKVIQSKRPGFSELNGTLFVNFQDGSSGSFTSYSNKDAPFTIEIISSSFRCISKESERKAYISTSANSWKWEEISTNIPFQSDMTNVLVEEIFKKEDCSLTPYHEASKLHLIFLESLIKFLNKSKGKKFTFIPFT